MNKLISLGILLISTGSLYAASHNIYISPKGSDSSSGSQKTPFASLDKGYRAACSIGGTDTIFVNIAPGRYAVTTPVVMDDSRSAPIVFRAEDPTNRPIFEGGTTISGWRKQSENGVWIAEVKGACDFEQFFVNGRRAVRARTPNLGEWMQVKGASEKVLHRGSGRTPAYATQSIRLDPELTAKLSGLLLPEIQRVVGTFYHHWDVTRKPLDYAVADSGFLFTSGSGMHPWNPINQNSIGFLENYIGALDQAGEWFCDQDKGLIYYIPRADEDLATAECIAPVTSKFIVLKGNESQPVKNKLFRDLVFTYTAYRMPVDGNDPMQAAAAIEAAIEADFAEGIRFDNCEVTHTGGFAFWLRRECHNNTIDHCMMSDLGAGGVKLGETGIRTDSRRVTSGNRVNNSIILHAGYIFPSAVGICIFQARDNEVTHNTIADIRYSGVSIGWKWGYNGNKVWTTDSNNNYVEQSESSPAVGNKVKYNHIHHIGWGEMSDMGAVYTLGESPGTEVSNNVIHDVYSREYGGWGLYTDEGSTDIVMENNLVYGCKSGGFHQHYGKENTIRNNIMAFSLNQQIQYTRPEEHSSFSFTRNIILQDVGITAAGGWRDGRYQIDSNLYWDINNRPLVFIDESFDQWRARNGNDANSLVADPLFVDPLKGDYRFRSTKNIRKIGFVPFDHTKVGVYGEEQWKQKSRLSDETVRAFAEVIRLREKDCQQIYK